MNTLIDVTGKLPRGLVEMYRKVDICAKGLGIDYLIVGAMARDLVMHHGFGAHIERGTRDVDFAIRVASWQEFNTLKEALSAQGLSVDQKLAYRLGFVDSDSLPWELDILPFGNVVDAHHDISWPPDGEFKMSTLGFPEALLQAWQVKITQAPECLVKVANPVAMIILKMVAWTERDRELRKKDAADIGYILQNYAKIPSVLSCLYEDGHMERCDWDEDMASAELLGIEIADGSAEPTRQYIIKHLVENQPSRAAFAWDMNPIHGTQWLDRLTDPLV
ncbi:nucleotidyl transferase AbiEii/AbiGii toxin family protein [Thalassolituus alkanivorans]|uniref:nucleotidyl transferase AbiEii/AbiGii toxin family protein n=1 Tax=Thalassolituus alkanivorans TaxID=2881055 RepID=UPI001E65A8D8|nr:nucleotidyl transferase AbiEii/AbiGii toxin family protein [Thalassolituus alkanivorans]MCB2385043.1 nucleotidyl transferase AbiEii/AbiGii toxin family protein [Thalassolituus alkanivorans]MCB2424515.1 nucleotidyl transferase AbiEii/AbiGii toxin family protein [Thalassolituus alkanivorans]